MLENIRIAKPCPANWDAMTGDERVRFCALCSKNVYNFAGMTRDEAEDLLTKTEGNVCVRLYKRTDGTVLTSDCPVGLAAVRRRLASLVSAGVALITLTWGLFTFGLRRAPYDGPTEPLRLQPTEQPLMGAPRPTFMMGDVTVTPESELPPKTKKD
ncbi:MAG TPA: hypothetical protein VFF73_23265 [Planctomycetota bacterium]|nr:hypothetical protein [Planctomycetota bacterium]